MLWRTVVSDLHTYTCMCRLVHADIYIIIRFSLLYNFLTYLSSPTCPPSFRKHNCIGHCTVDIEFGCEMPTRCDTARKYIENTHKER